VSLVTFKLLHRFEKNPGLWFELGSLFSDYQNFVSCLLVSSSAYDGNLVYMVTPYLDPYPYSWIELPLYTHTRLILTFVVMSRWTTLVLRRLMWKHGLS
jgi:hypothetical protein